VTAVSVNHRVDGPDDAPVIVFSHSLGLDLTMWDPQAQALASDFRVLRYDHRGHGGSPVPPGPYSIDDLGGDVVALLDSHRIERAHVCGLSLGGLVGLWLAVNAADRIDRLVLCCTAAHFGNPDQWEQRATVARGRGTGALALFVVDRWFTPEFARTNAELVERLKEMITSTPNEGYAACCEVVGATDLRPDLAAVRAPTLVIAGAGDPAAPVELGRTIADGISGARLEVLPDAAHLANLERADHVTRLIRNHLSNGIPT
jgi:3-oxoadipate enol-lactonase